MARRAVAREARSRLRWYREGYRLVCAPLVFVFTRFASMLNPARGSVLAHAGEFRGQQLVQNLLGACRRVRAFRERAPAPRTPNSCGVRMLPPQESSVCAERAFRLRRGHARQSGTKQRARSLGRPARENDRGDSQRCRTDFVRGQKAPFTQVALKLDAWRSDLQGTLRSCCWQIPSRPNRRSPPTRRLSRICNQDCKHCLHSQGR